MENVETGIVRTYSSSAYTDIDHEVKDRVTCAELLVNSSAAGWGNTSLLTFVKEFDSQTRGAYLYAPMGSNIRRALAAVPTMARPKKIAVFDKDTYRAIGVLETSYDGDANIDTEFEVVSDCIDNRRYRYGLPQRTKTSKHMKVALKTAVTTIRKATPFMLLQQTADSYQYELSNASYETENKVTRARREMTNNRTVMTDVLVGLLAHHETGSPPPILGTDTIHLIKDYVTKQKEDMESVAMRGTGVVFVNAFNLEHVLVCRCDMTKGSNERIGSAYTCTIDELSESIEGKLAVLAMVDNDKYVSGVGMKLAEDTNMFFLENTDDVHDT